MERKSLQTTRERKHDLLLTFMANAKPPRHKRTAPVGKPRFFRALVSLFV